MDDLDEILLKQLRTELLKYCEMMMRKTNLGKHTKIVFGGVKKRILDKGFISVKQFHFLERFMKYENFDYSKYEKLIYN